MYSLSALPMTANLPINEGQAFGCSIYGLGIYIPSMTGTAIVKHTQLTFLPVAVSYSFLPLSKYEPTNDYSHNMINVYSKARLHQI